MKFINLFQRILLGLIVFSTVISSVTISAQQSMSLGSLKFVMPNQSVVRSSRSLHMRMASTGISARIIARVGGVAFVQTAEPGFVVKSLKLGVDYNKNNAYAVINDTTYEIPLEVWELQPIVNYANQEDNAAVTLFGNADSRIQYHEAFLDNLMGLRMLQTDLILTDFLKSSDRGKLPMYSDGRLILSPNEEKEYMAWNTVDSLFYGMSYEDISRYSFYKVIHAMDSIGESYDTYIYTDYDQPIKFYIQKNEIKFDGFPYYRFASRDSALVDTLEMYYELKNFVDTFFYKRDKYNDLSISYIFRKSEIPIIYDLVKLTRSNKNVQKKALRAFEQTNYYSKCDSFGFNRENNFINALIPVILKEYVTELSDSITKYGSGNNELDEICKEYMSVKDSLKAYDYPIITAYANLIYKYLPNDSCVISMYDFSKNNALTYDKLLIEYMYNHKIPTAKTLINTTNYLRKHRGYTYMINPIVFDAAEKTCQWSAFFRYIKEIYNEEWQTFVKNVTKLKYDAPTVQTPIDFINEKY